MAARGRGPIASASRSPRILLPIALLFVLAVAGSAAASGVPRAATPLAAPAGLVGSELGGAASPSPASSGSIVNLTDGADPGSICDQGLYQCSALAGETQVTLQASAGVRGENAWPSVQLLFLLETTAYDGVFDPTAGGAGADPCAVAENGSGALCDESNLVPFFTQNLEEITEGIAGQYPDTQMEFGLVTYFATHDAWDHGGGSAYRVDVGRFTNASEFAGAVDQSFVDPILGGASIIPGSDLAENFLTSDSISALYEALLGGGGINWSDTSHHVIVVLGSTAPRDPSYPEDYCASPAVVPDGLALCNGVECEPSVTFSGGTSPACEGWITASDGNQSNSIAALSRTAPDCVASLGGNCTIDFVDVNDTPTDPWSPSWSASGGSGGPTVWTADATSILQAGCDLASATGGTWAGPTWFTCDSLGTTGTLVGVPFGDPDDPHDQNPTLLAALHRVGLGQEPVPVVAAGADQPMFEFIPWGNFVPAPFPDWTVACLNGTGAKKVCPQDPQVFPDGLTDIYGWNWSSDPSTNEMLLGDTWTATFWVDGTGPPFGLIPLDSCVTTLCLSSGDGAVGGAFTSMTFREYGGQYVVTESFQLIQVTLDPLNVLGGTQPPTPPTTPPGPASVPSPTPPGTPVPALPSPPIPAAVISVEAAAAGIITFAWTALGVRYPPQATKQASMSGALGKKKKRSPHYERLPLSRWE